MVLKVLEKAGEYLIPLLKEGVIRITSVPEEVADLRKQRIYIRALIRKEDRAAADAAAKHSDTRKGIIERATELRIIDFRMEDIIDEWNSYIFLESENAIAGDEGQLCDPGCMALPCENANNIVNIRYWGRLLLSFKIQKIKSDLDKICDGRAIVNEQSSSTVNADSEWKNLRRNHNYKDPTEIVGFKAEYDELICWLEDGRAECTVMVVVGMAGQGKTALARKIFCNKEVIGKFGCSAWINVSDFNDPTEFFRSMLRMLYEQAEKSLPCDLYTKDPESLRNEVKNYLSKKRYVLFFDDVWNKNFWQEIEHTVSNKGNGSRIIITTRNKEIANTCKNFTSVKVHEMLPLPERQSLELFFQTVSSSTFRSNEGLSQSQIKVLSPEIVGTCRGLPLGIVKIGEYVSVYKDAFKWRSKIEKAGITEIFCLSYDNLPPHLEPCLLYFGIYPQDYEVKSKRLIRQWIAEGFVEYKHDQSLEEVAEDYLASLIDRNLVQVSSLTIDGKPRTCRVHCLVHDMILRKFEDISFCRCINGYNRSNGNGITRRLSITANSIEPLRDDTTDKIKSSFIRSLHFFTGKELPKDVSRIPANCKVLKVLDFENSQLHHALEDLGNLIHLKYLSFRNAKIKSLPISIGNLHNLETLDLRQSDVKELPKEVCKLKKLRHLLGWVQLKDGIGSMRFLQTLRDVEIADGVGLIEKELGKLGRISHLRLTNVGEEHGRAVCSSINKMEHLEKLHIIAKSNNEVIDLQDLEKPSKLQKLCLQGKLSKLPEWVPDLVHLVKLILSGSKLTGHPLNSLKNMPNLLFLSILNNAYDGERLHFQDGDFENLVELELVSLHSLSSITFDSKALPSLKKLKLRDIPLLKTVPSGIQHLKTLENRNIQNMPTKFEKSTAPNGGQKHQSSSMCRT